GTASLSQLIYQFFCLFQICRIEAFGEPVVDFGEHRAGFVATTPPGEQPCKAGRRAKLPRFGTLASCNLDSLAEAALRILKGADILYEQSLALYAIQFGFRFTLRSLFYVSETLLNNVQRIPRISSACISRRSNGGKPGE